MRGRRRTRARVLAALLAAAALLALGLASSQALGGDAETARKPSSTRSSSEAVTRDTPPRRPPNRAPSSRDALRLDRLGIRERVAAYTTEFAPGEPRVVNIQRAAELLDGTIIPAGGRFSLNEALGERTTERGFVAAPMISGGRLVDSVGGGISQVATTLYNAAFFAGLELVEHRPHSFWIDRYPRGREATISWGGPELVFRNDWAAAVLLRVRARATSVTVTLYSDGLGRRVESWTGTPFAYTAPGTVTVPTSARPAGEEVVVQAAGAPGFTIAYGRRVYQDGTLRRTETFRVTYLAKNAIVEVGTGARGGR